MTQKMTLPQRLRVVVLLVFISLFDLTSPDPAAAQMMGHGQEHAADEIVRRPASSVDVAIIQAAFDAETGSADEDQIEDGQKGEAYRRRFVGSSVFILANALPLSNSPSFYQLNYGYRLTRKDAVSIEAITWRYHAPLGIPYGPSLDSPDEEYPGHVREYGVGLAYQRFFWRNVYAAVHALPLLQRYVNDDREIIQKGFQLFLTARIGYHWRLFQDRFFLEPNIAFTHWPVNTNVPESFSELESRWPNFFLFEPGLHFGIAF